MTERSDNGRVDEEAPADSTVRSTADAERIAEEWAAKIAHLVVRGAARAKEEAEDIWAEAQALRRNL